MHEMSLCEGIRDIVVKQSAEQHFSRVKILRLEIGRFACVEENAMRFAYDVVMRGSPAEGSALEIINIPAKASCFDCGEHVILENRLDPCPLCASNRVVPVSGEELRVKNMEVE